jgi:hypothetical protein
MDPQTQVDISSLSDADKKELNAVLTNEAQKSNIQQGKWSYRSSALYCHDLGDLKFTDSVLQLSTP